MSLTVSWRKLKPEDALALDFLLKESFPVPPGGSFFDDFPYWNPKLNTVKVQWGGFDPQGNLVASASLRVGRLITHPKQRMGVVGAVCTSQSHRGKGLATQAVEKILEEGKKLNISAYFLWAGQPDLYQKFGFKEFSKQHRIELSQIELESKIPLVSIKEGLTPKVFELCRQRQMGFELFEDDLSWMKRHINVKWVWLEKASQVIAYVAIGRGIDLQGIIHDFGGQSDALETLLALIKNKKPELQIMCHPIIKSEYQFLNWAPPGLIETLCLAKFEDQSIDQNYESRGIWFWGLDSC